METISYKEFAKIDLRVGEIKQATPVEGTDKLLKLTVDLGSEQRTLVAGIRLYYSPEELVGKKIIILANLEEKTIKGIQSQGMLLAAGETAENVSLLVLDKDMPVGTRIH